VESSDVEKFTEHWCKALISFRTAEIKARVDTVYLKSLSDQVSSELSSASNPELQQRKQALQAELEDLHVEVASIAEMVVDHELRKPVNESKERKEKEWTLARTAWLNYVRIILIRISKTLTLLGSFHTQIYGQPPEYGHRIHSPCRRISAGSGSYQ
jgi:hypothetical protein